MQDRISPRAIFVFLAALAPAVQALAGQGQTRVPELVIGYHNAQRDCLEKYAARGAEGRPPVAQIHGRLDGQRRLYGLICNQGAYNVVYRFYVVGKNIKGGIDLAQFGYPDEKGKWKKMDGLLNAEYSARRKILKSHALGRGLGDCYSSYTYKWSPKRGIFVLMEYWLDDACDEKDNARLIYRHRAWRK